MVQRLIFLKKLQVFKASHLMIFLKIGMILDTDDKQIYKDGVKTIHLHYNSSGDVPEYHTVAGFISCLTARTRSSNKLLFKLVLV